jgi:hypothetical protein
MVKTKKTKGVKGGAEPPTNAQAQVNTNFLTKQPDSENAPNGEPPQPKMLPAIEKVLKARRDRVVLGQPSKSLNYNLWTQQPSKNSADVLQNTLTDVQQNIQQLGKNAMLPQKNDELANISQRLENIQNLLSDHIQTAQKNEEEEEDFKVLFADFALELLEFKEKLEARMKDHDEPPNATGGGRTLKKPKSKKK